MELASKDDKQLNTWIVNHEAKGETDRPFYRELLEERARRAQAKHGLDIERSLAALKEAAIGQVCVTYGDVAAANGVSWSKARRQMSGAGGHLDRIVDVCHARGLPLLTAICVNKESVATGELGEDALDGFAAAAKRLGMAVHDPKAFHHESRDRCWEWGRAQRAV